MIPLYCGCLGASTTEERIAVSGNASNGSSSGVHASASSNAAAESTVEGPAPPSVAEYSNGRFEEAAARPDPRVAQVALDPAATPLLDLNAATFLGGDPNRITLSDLILNDGVLQASLFPYILESLVRAVAVKPQADVCTAFVMAHA